MTWNIPVLFILGNFCMTTIKPCFQIVSVPFQIWLWKLLSVMWNSSMVSSFVHLILSFSLKAQDSPISYLSKCSLILWNMKMQSFKSQGIKASHSRFSLSSNSIFVISSIIHFFTFYTILNEIMLKIILYKMVLQKAHFPQSWTPTTCLPKHARFHSV